MTAYGLRISDWSSDVCSSDLEAAERTSDDPAEPLRAGDAPQRPAAGVEDDQPLHILRVRQRIGKADGPAPVVDHKGDVRQFQLLDQPAEILGMELRQIGWTLRLVGQAEAQMIRRNAAIAVA